MTIEQRSIYSGPIRRSLEQLARQIADLEVTITALDARVVTLHQQLAAREERDGG